MPKIHSKQISKELSLLRVDDDEVRYFEALWEIENGITYNSYLLTGEDEVILVDGWKREYADDFSEALKDLI
ncbi:MAG TPA: FprA family A-type flavoprotein, partial [Nitrososphaeria archaeon]|nr:FprA family A-type flavoprotein [Nitrososphaeria archaeon]